jgi:hypothetical protein
VTLGTILDKCMGRLNLTSDDARDRLQGFADERHRRIQTSCGLGQLRRGLVSLATVDGTSSYTPEGIVKPISITIPAISGRVVHQRTLSQLREMEESTEWVGSPEFFAVTNYGAADFTIEIRPTPNAIYTLSIDGILVGSDFATDEDIPGVPEDFHDALVFGILADEYDHFDRDDLSGRFEAKYDRRVGDLRYFIGKSGYLHRTQGGSTLTDGWWSVNRRPRLL